jgi:hypothetical protein
MRRISCVGFHQMHYTLKSLQSVRNGGSMRPRAARIIIENVAASFSRKVFGGDEVAEPGHCVPFPFAIEIDNEAVRVLEITAVSRRGSE